MENSAKFGDAKMEVGSSSEQDSSSINRDMIGSWSDLPADLLDLILRRLGAIEFLICACVCKSWRSAATGAGKKEFMDNQPPLILQIPNPTNVCRFFSLSHADDGRESVVTCKRRLPSNTFSKTCIGCSCGYLFMLDVEEENTQNSQLLLINPFTGHELQFPYPWNFPGCKYILATCIQPYPQFVVIAFSSFISPSLQFCRYGDDGWTFVNTRAEFHWVEDVAVYEGRAYVLGGRDASIGVLNLDSPPHLVSVMKLQGIVNASRYSEFGSRQLIAAPDRQQLLLVDGVDCGKPEIYRLDLLSQQWIRVNTIGDQTLFVGGSIKRAGGLFSPPTIRMIKRYMDVDAWQDCYYDMISHEASVGIILVGGIGCNSRPRVRFQRLAPNPDLQYLYFWYFPSLSCTVDCISS